MKKIRTQKTRSPLRDLLARYPQFAFMVLVLVVSALVLAWWNGGVFHAPVRNAQLHGADARTGKLRPLAFAFPPGELKDSIVAAGDYLVRQQFPNGDLSYQVDIRSGSRKYLPISARQLYAAGSLYTVCRVAQEERYCDAADRSLTYYLKDIVAAPQPYAGVCYSSYGGCILGISGLAIDALHKRWVTTGSTQLGSQDTLALARELGVFLLSMQKSPGVYDELLYPLDGGPVDAAYTSWYDPGQTLLAFAELYGMTGDAAWLQQARTLDAAMRAKPVVEDHWHAGAMRALAELSQLEPADVPYGTAIGRTIFGKQSETLDAKNSSITVTTKVEALSALALAMLKADAEHLWLANAFKPFAQYVQARQVPASNCPWALPASAKAEYAGGIFTNCEDPVVRVDALAHWINGGATILEYQALIAEQAR